MSERGFIHQCSDEQALDAVAAQGSLTAYIGFDCTAPSLHVGNLLGIMVLRKLQQSGHKPIIVIGGGTTRIGDPSGTDKNRRILTDEEININIEGISQVFSRFLNIGDGPTDALIINNDLWLRELNYIDFLCEYGRHFSVNRMLTFDSVKLRLERDQSLSFIEFNYMVIQAYDFLELNQRYNCVLQMGGSDQWGNIINGIELSRRVNGVNLFALTTPLLTTASGTKMGKTEKGAVWLNEVDLSSYDYWQFWRNTDDSDVIRFLRLFTDLPPAEIDRLGMLQGHEVNEAKKILATEATRLAHGDEAAEQAAQAAHSVFENNAPDDALPTYRVSKAILEQGLGLQEACRYAELAASNSEARRHIRNKAVRVNNTLIEDEAARLYMSDLSIKDIIKLSVGKKRHALIKVVD
ncbi:MAG: tyrosine--tRNA ligase [Parvularculales bacterium]